MLVLAIHTHPSEKCPGSSPEGMRQMFELFSEEHATKEGVGIVGCYMNCQTPTTPGIHEGYFIVEALTVQAVSKFLSPLEVKAGQVWDMRDQMKKIMK